MRYIALLEFQPDLAVDVMPPSSYLEKTNGSLPQLNCRLRTDENGFIVSEKPCGPADSKVLLLGGSAIENLYIPPERKIVSRIETLAAQQGKKAKVYNAGISNAHLLHMINILVNKGIPLKPKCVVFYPTPGIDLTANTLDNTFWNPAGNMTPVRKAGQETKPETPVFFPNTNDYKDERRLLGAMHDICANFGIVLVVATWPIYGAYDDFMKKYQPNQASFEDEQARTVDLNEVIREVCREKDIDLIDLERTFADLDHHRYFYDWNHPSADGCELIASVTALALQPYL